MSVMNFNTPASAVYIKMPKILFLVFYNPYEKMQLLWTKMKGSVAWVHLILEIIFRESRYFIKINSGDLSKLLDSCLFTITLKPLIN